MAYISKITDVTGATYDLKDSQALTGIGFPDLSTVSLSYHNNITGYIDNPVGEAVTELEEYTKDVIQEENNLKKIVLGDENTVLDRNNIKIKNRYFGRTIFEISNAEPLNASTNKTDSFSANEGTLSGSNRIFWLSYSAISISKVTVDQNEITNGYTYVMDQNCVKISTAKIPSDTSAIEITYQFRSEFDGGVQQHFYTLGTRKEEEPIGQYSIAEGNNLTASGAFSYAEGLYASSTGIIAHAEGDRTIASGYASHAEGYKTNVSGLYSHAEGSETKVSEYYSHAEGHKTEASGEGSHAEGMYTKAGAKATHAEGRGTQVTNEASHAEGYYSEAHGYCSHAQNQFTIARGKNQTALGKFNIADLNNQYAVIVGNGVNGGNRSNALTLDWDGNATIAGDLVLTPENSTANNSSKNLVFHRLNANGDDVSSSIKMTKTGILSTDHFQIALNDSPLLKIKDTGIDASLATNGLSSTATHYPGFAIYDNADRIVSRVESSIKGDGTIAAYWYVRNYDTGGTYTGQKGIKITVDKAGTATYAIGDAANFRTALALNRTQTALTLSNTSAGSCTLVRNAIMATVFLDDIKLSAALASGSSITVATVPAGYRPAKNAIGYLASTTNGQAPVKWYINTSGAVAIQNRTSASLATSIVLSGVITYVI